MLKGLPRKILRQNEREYFIKVPGIVSDTMLDLLAARWITPHDPRHSDESPGRISHQNIMKYNEMAFVKLLNFGVISYASIGNWKILV